MVVIKVWTLTSLAWVLCCRKFVSRLTNVQQNNLCPVFSIFPRHDLLPAKRDAQLASRLRSTMKYPTVRASTNRFKKLFHTVGTRELPEPLAVLTVWMHFNVNSIGLAIFYCMCVCAVLIQPVIGCHNPINYHYQLSLPMTNSQLARSTARKWQKAAAAKQYLCCSTIVAKLRLRLLLLLKMM